MVGNYGTVNGVPVVGTACGDGTGDVILITADGARWFGSANPMDFKFEKQRTGVVTGVYRPEGDRR